MVICEVQRQVSNKQYTTDMVYVNEGTSIILLNYHGGPYFFWAQICNLNLGTRTLAEIIYCRRYIGQNRFLDISRIQNPELFEELERKQ